MDYLGFVANVLGIGGAIFALLAWLKAKKIQEEMAEERSRQNKKIVVSLQYGSKQLKLPVDLRRAELSRAEILGRIGMIPMKEKGQRFTIEYLHTPEFLQQINNIIEENGEDVLTIPCNASEYNQFKL